MLDPSKRQDGRNALAIICQVLSSIASLPRSPENPRPTPQKNEYSFSKEDDITDPDYRGAAHKISHSYTNLKDIINFIRDLGVTSPMPTSF